MRNARFWIWYQPGDCWVKLTLKPGQSLSVTWGGPHEEGYSYSAETYEFDGQDVICECTTQACDCDGRLDTRVDLICHLDDLRSRDVFADSGLEDSRGILAPEWNKVTAFQRDYTAEAAGY
jgi:hypothetical protein